jgi:hypothetical protein
MKYDLEMGPGAMRYIYISSFMQIGSANQTLIGAMHRQISLLLFFINRESRLKIMQRGDLYKIFVYRLLT